MKKNRLIKMIVKYGLTMTAVMMLAGCENAQTSVAEGETGEPEIVLIDNNDAFVAPDETIMALTPDGPLLPSVVGVEADYSEPIPDYLRVGMQHPIVEVLQERLMELGFMDYDEPTELYGEVTQNAVKVYQRQNQLVQDGIIGPDTLEAILSPNAKYYAAQHGDNGEDIQRIQTRLYELGYLATANLVTGTFGDSTQEAVVKMQSVNDLEQDGKVGRRTMDRLYSDEVRPNMLAYGEKSDVVLAAQQRLKLLGYMTSEPDGSYGNDTIIAVKQFQSKNDQVVDGYLGPSTRIVLNSSDAKPNGMSLGDQGETVERVQRMLSQLGYLNSANTTGYYGEVTENAVKLFQKTNGLSDDGSVGALTMASLTGSGARRAPANSGGSSGSGNSSSGRNTGNGSSNSSGGSTSGSGGGSTSTPNTGNASGGAANLISIAQSKLGSPYVWGAKGPNSFDCSGFVYWCLNKAGVSQSYLTSSGWRSVGKYQRVSSFSDLRAGDIVVVRGHVGIVAGGGTVIDASSGNGRVVHRSLGSWWSRNFICGWRIFG